MVRQVEHYNLDAIISIQDIDVELGKSNVLRQSILKKAFTGQLVGQDSNDEPASVLLEHIQADKVKQAAKKKARKRKATTSSTRQKRAPV